MSHLTDEQLSALADGALAGGERVPAERHLEGCPRCRGACDSLRRTLALCRAAPAEPVPPELRARVQRAIGDVLSARH
jgi:RNA polymerase sigma-70 factor (ECF subfamily)